MFFAELLQMLSYVVQQAGVLILVGAQTIVLVAHLRELHTPQLHEREERLLRGARAARLVALVLIIASGATITAWHGWLGAWDVLMAPAFVLKWALIVTLLLLHFAARPTARLRWALEGVAGGACYAMLIIDLVAPLASWGALGTLLLLWMAAFGALWTGASALIKSGTPS